MQPYFYKLKHLPSGRYYVGSQYGLKSDPTNLLKTYVTSSKYVKQLIEQDGIDSFKIERIVIREDAREYEAKFLKRLYRKLGNDRFLEVMINRNIAPGILSTPEIVAKANIKRKVSNSIAAKRRLKNGTHNFQLANAGNLPHVRKLRSERMKGNNYGALKEITDDFRQKCADGAKGNTNVRGRKWWTNGTEYKRSVDCPGEGFYLGSKPHSSDTMNKMADAHKGKTFTEEHKRKLSIKAKQRPSNVKGTIWVVDSNGNRRRVKPDLIPDGFIPVNKGTK